LAEALSKTGAEVFVFLIGDAAACAKSGQRVPSGYYNLELMLRAVIRNNGVVGVCGSCMDARGIGDEGLVSGTRRSSMDELTQWTANAEKVLVF
jgi:uncharacterized protein involved in oxidation of intracellular sulfur